MPEKKNQHFVPRLMLRRFSSDKKNVGTFVLEQRKRIDGAAIAHQCAEDYLYGRDGDMENTFETTESQFASILGPLTPSHLDRLTDEELDHVRRFVYYQRYRTRHATDDVDEWGNAAMKVFLSITGKAKGIDLSLVKLKRNGGAAANVSAAAIASVMVMDLQVKFVIAESSSFVISDHPVVFYNDFVEHNRYLRDLPGATGLAAKGLQMFMPVSPRVTIVIFDPTSYACGDDASHICHATAGDVELLNRMQAVNADKCIFFSPERTTESLDELAEFRARNPLERAPEFWEGPLRPQDDGTFRQTTGFVQPVMRLRRRLSFCRIIERDDYSKYVAPSVPIRSFEMVELAQQFEQYVKGKIKEDALARGIKIHPHWEQWLSEDGSSKCPGISSLRRPHTRTARRAL